MAVPAARLTINEAIEPAEYSVMDITNLHVDDRYQRPRKELWVRFLALRFNALIAAMKPLVVNVRDNGVRAIIDGQHLAAAAASLGINALPTVQFRGLPLETEARLFHDLNRNRREMDQLPMYRALLQAGDPSVIALDRAIRAQKFQPAMTMQKDGDIQAVAALFWLFQKGGDALVTDTLATIRATWGLSRKGARQGVILRGIGTFIHRATLADGERFDLAQFQESIRGYPVEDLTMDARGLLAKANLGGSNSQVKATAVQLGKRYNDSVAASHRIDFGW